MSPVTVPVPKQPSMDVYTDEKAPVYDGEHSHVDLDENQQWSLRTTHTHAGHKHCHNSRLKRFLVPVVVALVAVCSLIGLYCLLGGDMADPGEIVEGLFYAKRQFDGGNGGSGSGSGNGTESDFTRRKLYLIVIFVGLFVVVILGIMLAAWCCKGSFQNPLCCPCYLCACCGGLACLECIGCGLCAEGVDQM
ncbi:hypothetical protein R3P38DRAFT_3042927 [Favolaschia claudopus]|uniref:Transmembrane protein n=1 Tax=Favolaschia claudopus TaxID=2862362 RepID=A0AAW0A884_9AGAR